MRLVKLWVSRHTFFYGIYKAHGSPMGFKYTQRDIDSFLEEPEIEAEYHAAPKATQQRVQQIRRLHPRIVA